MKNGFKKVLLTSLICILMAMVVACSNDAEGPETKGDVNNAATEVQPEEKEEIADVVEEESAQDKKEEQLDKKATTPEKTEAPKAEKPTEKPYAEPSKEPVEVEKEETSAPTAETARKYIGKSVSSLVATIGQPSGKSYASSCIGDGEDGEWYYPGFTVYTYRDTNGSERVEDVF